MLKHWWQFLLDMVNISGILPYKIPKYTLTYAIYFDWRSTILWLRNVLKQYFNDWFVSFKQQDDNFSKTEKVLYHNKHVRDNTFMTSIWKAEGRGAGGGGGYKIYRMSTDSFVFKQKIYCSFLWMEGVEWGSHYW